MTHFYPFSKWFSFLLDSNHSHSFLFTLSFSFFNLGGIEQITSVFNKSPTFGASAINGEVNAIYGDGVTTASALGRALSEATDINDWFNADAKVLSRIIARTASFGSGELIENIYRITKQY